MQGTEFLHITVAFDLLLLYSVLVVSSVLRTRSTVSSRLQSSAVRVRYQTVALIPEPDPPTSGPTVFHHGPLRTHLIPTLSLPPIPTIPPHVPPSSAPPAPRCTEQHSNHGATQSYPGKIPRGTSDEPHPITTGSSLAPSTTRPVAMAMMMLGCGRRVSSRFGREGSVGFLRGEEEKTRR